MSRRVVQVLGRSAGGIARHVAFVAGALDGYHGLDVEVAGPSDLPVPMPPRTVALEIPGGVRGHWTAVRDLEGLLARRSYDVVHAHGLRAGIDASVAARRRGLPALVTVHNLVRPEMGGQPRALVLARAEPLLVRLATHVFAVSDEIAARLRHAAPGLAHKVELLHLGVGPPPAVTRSRAEVRAELRVAPGAPLVVSVARLRPQKDLGTLVRAVAALPADVHLALVGEGPLASQLRALAGDLGVSERVRLLGWRDDVADLVAAADVFCLSSVWEGVPLAAQEAIQLGTPVVATRVGGMAELVEDGVSGFLVPPGRPGDLANALASVVRDPAAAVRLAGAARRGLERNFSTDRMLARLREAYS
ncbi:MAG TPA: glycosyltransferase family 4 protein [Actinomycetota bacterium]|nr:glycosyltransferase family 4 protein [Actinomycetota bacterium]